jgi:excisionase family DNA binding protein
MSYRLLKPLEISQILGISRSLAYRLMQSGSIPAIKIGRCVRARPEDLDTFISRNIVTDKVETGANRVNTLLGKE